MAKLMCELPGILRWTIEGTMEWRSKGLNPPKAIRTRTEQYINKADFFEEFLKSHIVEDTNGFVPTLVLFRRPIGAFCDKREYCMM
jgi:putative DNA primase/helicase